MVEPNGIEPLSNRNRFTADRVSQHTFRLRGTTGGNRTLVLLRMKQRSAPSVSGVGAGEGFEPPS